MDTRTCHTCGSVWGKKEWCATCVEAFDHRRPAEEMTPEERMAEMQSWRGPCEIPFSLIHKRFEELVGRPVWTHEIGLDWEGLVLEAGGRREQPTMEGIIDLVPAEKRIIVAT